MPLETTTYNPIMYHNSEYEGRADIKPSVALTNNMSKLIEISTKLKQF
jgi:hypothetical protein